MRICLIGAGWYSCHLARVLLNAGHSVTVFERDGIFAAASGNNQDRVHLGFHYPRSAKTRSEIKHCHDRFVRDYPTVELERNLYAVSHQSHIDFPTYTAICKSAGLHFVEVCHPGGYGLDGVEGAVLTRERVVNTPACRQRFQDILGHLVRKEDVSAIRNRPDGVEVCDEHFDAAINCTNLRLADQALPVYYEAAMILNLSGPATHPSVTVMDGPFPTLLGTVTPGEFTMSHVTHTAMAKCDTYGEALDVLHASRWEDRAELYLKEMEQYLPTVRVDFTVTGCRKAVRTKPRNNTDSRECLTASTGRTMTVVCGKFASVYLAQERVFQWLKSVQPFSGTRGLLAPTC